MKLPSLAALLLLLVPAPAAADDELAATMTCERAAQPGRVRCAAEVKVTGDRTLAWADVTLVELPDNTSALKGRIGPADATAKDPSHAAWAFGLVAKKAGQGDARAKVRAVVCEAVDGGAPRCTPRTIEISAKVVVGG